MARIRSFGGVVLLGGLLCGQGSTGAQTASTSGNGDGAPVHMTAAQDRARMLGLLGLDESKMRPRPDGDAKSPNATNYDEAKANVYRNLPDPLTFKDGRKVTTAGQWTQREKEIREYFEKEILGRAPEPLPKVTWQVTSTKREKFGQTDVLLKRLSGHVDNSIDNKIAVNIDMLVMTPAGAKGPVPLILELAFWKDFEAAVAGSGPKPATPWDVDGRLALERGWGFAILNPVSIQADDGAGLTEGIIGLMNRGQPRKPEDWGALRAWAWGASRALDYLETDPAVDAKQVGLAGHSRFGKASLVTLAYDRRFAIAYISSSGEGGAKLYRHIFGEQMANVAGPSLYHWFAGNFLRYGGPLNAGDLPVDNHELIALCAPRPVFIGSGASVGDGYADPSGDAWADARGMFLAEVAAGPVYRLVGAKGLGTSTYPPVGTAVMTGDLAFRQHEGGHLAEPNWPYFLEFAARYLHVGAAGPKQK